MLFSGVFRYKTFYLFQFSFRNCDVTKLFIILTLTYKRVLVNCRHYSYVNNLNMDLISKKRKKCFVQLATALAATKHDFAKKWSRLKILDYSLKERIV